ncbi:MAG: DsbC family protein [Maricaulaceae bacterium]
MMNSKNWIMLGLGVFGGVALMSGLSATKSDYPKTVPDDIQAKIEKEFPNTDFIDFNQTEYGLIEAMTSKNIFYFDQKAKVAIVGELLDIENKTAITVQRRRDLAKFADLDKTASGSGQGAVADQPRQAAPAPMQGERPPVANVDLSEIPESNYVVHNKGAGPVLYVVSDINCIFCKRLNEELKNVDDIEVREILVRFMSDDSTIFGAHALCAENPSQAVNALFGGDRSSITTCEEGVSAIGFNTEWASKNGIGGTPALITPDGRVSSGFRELSAIRAFVSS